MADAVAYVLPPPSIPVIHLAVIELVIYALSLPLAVYIAWKHGKNGMTAWPIFVSFLGMRIVSDAYQIANRTQPNLPNVLMIMTNAGSVTCLQLTLIGIVYEANIVLPYPKRWTEKIILGVTHVINTAGIGLATYGGAPSATGIGGVTSEMLNRIGNIVMVIVLLAVCVWIGVTWKRVMTITTHPIFWPVLVMLTAACVGIPFQLVRLAYHTTYSFEPDSTLDPVMGTFATKLLFVFFTQLGLSIAVFVGGWMGITRTKSSVIEDQVFLREFEVYASGSGSTPFELNERLVRPKDSGIKKRQREWV